MSKYFIIDKVIVYWCVNLPVGSIDALCLSRSAAGPALVDREGLRAGGAQPVAGRADLEDSDRKSVV